MKVRDAASTHRMKGNMNLGKHGSDAALNAGHIKSGIPKNHLGSRPNESEKTKAKGY